ncbi:MAG: right-handed parallel beta-helix repeat-containing protein [Candidatus Micrarchaeota archaeon]
MLVLAGTVFSETNLTDCAVLGTQGETYLLTQDISGAPNGGLPVTGTACVHINSSDVLFDCAGFSMTHNRTMNTFGIFAGANLTNVTIRNCPDISGFYRGIYLYNVNSSVVRNVTAQHNAYMGFYVWQAGDLTFTNNTAFNNTQHGAYFTFNPRNNTITGNTAHSHTLWGFVVTNGAAGNNVSGNTAYNNSGDGLMVSGSDNTVSGNLAYENGNEIFLGNGINIGGSNNTVTGNIAGNNTRSGFWISGSSGTFTGNDAGGNTRDGFYIESGSGNNLTGNTASGNGRNGFLLSDADSNWLEGNDAAGNNASGFNLTWGGEGDPSENNTFDENNVSGNAMDGFYLDLATDNLLLSNRISGNGRAGVYLSPGEDPFITGNGTYLSGNALYSNGYDLIVNSTPPMSFVMEGNLFLNPAGTIENYTNLSINDTVDAEAYSINWTSNSSELPSGYSSFLGKFVEITDLQGGASIDSAVWHYLDSEAAGFDESAFEIYEYDGAWWDAGATRDTLANTLTLSNLSSFSEFGILEGGAGCPVISAPGAYVQPEDLTGAPNPVSGGTASNACVVINAGDVAYDCNGFNITSNSSGAAGIHITGDNVTITNCPGISGYLAGVQAVGATNLAVLNTTINSTTFGDNGIWFNVSENVTVADSALVSYEAFYGGNVTALAILRTNITGNNAGAQALYLTDSSGVSMRNGTVLGTGTMMGGFNLSNVLADNMAFNASAAAFRTAVQADANITLTNSVLNNCGTCVDSSNPLINSGILLIENNTMEVANYGIHVNGAESVTFRNNSVSGAGASGFFPLTEYGFYGFNITDYTLIENNRFVSDSLVPDAGIYYQNMPNAQVLNNTFEDYVTYGIFQFDSPNGSVMNNAFSGIGTYGIYSDGSEGSVYRSNDITMAGGSGSYGIFSTSANVTYDDITVLNSGYGIYSSGAGGSNYSNLDLRNFPNYGLFISSADGSAVENVTIRNATYGMFLQLNDNIAFRNVDIGAYFSNNGSGIYYVAGTNNSFENVHLHGFQNNFESVAVPFPSEYATSGMVFDFPPDGFTQFTNLSIEDDATNESYSIRWQGPVGTPSADHVSFENKFVQMLSAGTPYIDRAVWTWTDAEAAGYDEGKLELWRFYTTNGTWELLNDTPDETNNMLAVESLQLSTPAAPGFFALFENQAPDCLVITSPGAYVQAEDITGSPNPVDAPDLPGYQACIVIDSDDVEYDCAGHSLTGNLSSDSIGIFANRTSNVTVRNCGVFDYNYGAVSYGGSGTAFENLTVGWGQGANLSFSEGLLLVNGTGHTVFGNTVNVSESAIRLTGNVSGANVSGNTIPEARYGIHLTGTLNDSDFNDNMIANVEDGFRVPGGSWIGEEVNVTGNRFRGNSVTNSSHAFIIVNSTGNTYEYNTIENAFQEGFYILESRNNISDSVFRYNSLTNVDDAFYLYYSANNIFEGNNVNGTFSYVFWFLEAGNSTISDNLIPSARYMAYFDNSPGISLTNNAANGTGEQYAAQVVSSSNFYAFNNTIAGFQRGPWHWDAFSGASNANVTYVNNTFANFSGGEALYCVFCPNSTFSGNLFANVYTGMLIGDSNNTVISDNTILNKSSGSGFSLYDLVNVNVSGNRIQGSYVPNVTFDSPCLIANGILNGRFANNSLERCYQLASFLNMNASVIDNLTLSNGNTAFTLQSSFGNAIGNVTAANITDSFSAGRGAQLFNSSDNQLRNFSLSGSGTFGAHLSNTSSNVLENFNISGAGTGLFMGEGPGDDQLYDFHFSNNSRDVHLNVTTAMNIIHMFNAIFDSPAGNFQNFTNLTIHDTVNAGESFSMSWSANSSQPPWPIFIGKHISITNHTYIGIDLATWHWTDAEAAGYNESRFQVWKDNGTWSDAGAFLDTGANTLTLEEYDSFSGFAILTDGNCPVVNESGTYLQTPDFAGAPNAAAHGPTSACVVIDADDVVFDCDGHSIANNGSYASAFYVNNRSNTSIRNCITDGYVDDIYAQQSGISEVSDNRFNATYSVLELNASASPGLSFVRNNISSSGAYALINARNYYDGLSLSVTDISGSLVENNTVDGVSYTEIVSEASNLSGITLRGNDFNAGGLYAIIYADDHFGAVHTRTDLSNALIENNSADVSYAAIVSDAADVRNLIVRNNSLGVPGGMYAIVASQVYFDGTNAYVTDLSNATIQSNAVNLGVSAIAASSGADVSGLTMRDNSFNGSGIFSLVSLRRTAFGPAITPAGFENALIENNTLANLSFTGLELYGADASNLVFRNNTASGPGIYAMMDIGSFQTGNDVYPTDMYGSLIDGNLFERISYTGINARGSDLSGMVFRNNSLLNNESSGSAYAAFNIQSIDNGTDLLARGNMSGATIGDNRFSGFSIILSLTGADASAVSLARNNATTVNQMNSFIYAYPQASGPTLFSHVDLSGANISDNNATYYAYGINAQGTDLTGSLISGNTFSAGPSPGAYGIILQSYSPGSMVYASDISGTSVLGNDFREYSSGIYLFDSMAADMTVEGNGFADYLATGSNGIHSSWSLNPAGVVSDSRISENEFENFNYGVSLFNGSNVTVANNTFVETGYPVYLVGNSLDRVSGNVMADIGTSGIYLLNSINNTVSGNDIAGASYAGIEVISSSGNTFQGDVLSGIISYGVYMGGANNNSFDGTSVSDVIAGSGAAYGFSIGGGSGNNFTNVTVQNVSSSDGQAYGLYLGGSSNNTFLDSSVSDVQSPSSTAYGVYLGGSNGNSFTNVSSGNVSSASGDASGFYLGGSNNNTLLNTSAADNPGYGFYLSGATGNLISGSIASGNGQAGLYSSGSSGNSIDSNVFSGNAIGYRLSGSGNNAFTDNMAANNTQTGALVHFGSSNNNFTSETAYGNGEGIETGDGASGNLWNGAHLYGNTLDFLYNGSSSSFNLSGVAFDSPAGLYQNFTNLSVNDSIGSPERYHIAWDSEPAAPPNQSFAQKYVELVNYTPVSIDSAAWHWTDAESSPYDESTFALWKYNGTWNLMNGTPDTAANELGLGAIDSFSTFAILYGPTAVPVSDDDDDTDNDPLRISLESSCGGNTVTVRSGSSPVSGATVRIEGESAGATNSSGMVSFKGCGITVDIRAAKPGYATQEDSFELVSCTSCENETEPVPPQPEYGCYSDADCADTEYCEGAPAGECMPVQPGACGEVKGHAFVPYGYECGSEPGCPTCPAGADCVGHMCVSYGLSGPQNVMVNGTAIISATNSTNSCALCDILIIDPAGRVISGRTDAQGRFMMPAPVAGSYNVTLMVDGNPYQSILVTALPVSEPPEPEKPPAAAMAAEFPWWLLIILLLVIAGLLYWRRRKKK